MSDAICKANVRIETRDVRTGELLDVLEKGNLMVNMGSNVLRNFMAGDYSGGHPGFGYIGLGTGTTDAALTDEDLTTPIARYAVDSATKGERTLTIVYVLASGTANGNTITEAGLFDAASGGSMYAHVVHEGYVKAAGITKTYTWVLSWVPGAN